MHSNPDDAAGLDLVRVVTGPLVPLWPFRGPRVVARMWNADGKHVACVGRSVVVNAGADKYRTSKHATGLIGGSLEAEWLGGARDRRTVVMVEGVTDWLWASLRCLRGEVAWPVIGYQAGNRGNVERVRWDGERVFVATDTDTAGDKFSCVIREAIGARATVERVRWDGVAKDLSAWDGDLVGLIQERLRGRQ